MSFDSVSQDVIQDEKNVPQERIGAAPANFNNECMAMVNQAQGRTFKMRTQARFEDKSNSVAICRVSKKHPPEEYWYRFDPEDRKTLETDPVNNIAVFGCGDASTTLAFAGEDFLPFIDNFGTTDNEKTFYWHVQFKFVDGRWLIKQPRIDDLVDVTKFLLSIPELKTPTSSRS